MYYNKSDINPNIQLHIDVINDMKSDKTQMQNYWYLV